MICDPVVIVQAKSNVNFVDCIASTGEQYINTGFVPSSTSKVEVAFVCEEVQGVAVCGAEDAWKRNGFAVYTHLAEYGSTTLTIPTGTGKRNVILDQGAVFLNGELVNTIYSPTFSCSLPFIVFARNRGGAIGEGATAKLYGLKIWDNGYIVRDYRPCVDEQGVPCLYERLNERYVYNDGTGEFTVG